MKILALFYTNNKVKPVVLEAVATNILNAARFANLAGGKTVHLAVSSWQRVPGWKGGLQYISPYRFGGHLNICMQVLKVLYEHSGDGFDYVAFLEHDVLYAPNYFERLAGAAKEGAQLVVNHHYIGLNAAGFQRPAPVADCLSQMMMAYPLALFNFERAMRDCALKGNCYLEPSFDVPTALVPVGEGDTPNVHINMNMTNTNHHLTNHYDLYEKEPFTRDHPLWGRADKYAFFTP